MLLGAPAEMILPACAYALLSQAATTELLEAAKTDTKPQTPVIGGDGASADVYPASANGNGAHAETIVVQVAADGQENAAHSTGASNGAAVVLPPPPAVIPSTVSASLQASTASPAASASSKPTAAAAQSLNSLDVAMDPKVAGQVETVAVTTPSAATGSASTSASQAAEKKKLTAAGTPYKNPGGRWSNVKSYSVFQVGERAYLSSRPGRS